MAKRTKAQREDRVTFIATGARGTIVDVHPGPKGSVPSPAYSVLPDVGRKRTVVWKGADAQWEPPSGIRHCHRCREDGHTVVQCPRWDCGYQLTTEAFKALEGAGYDPRTMPVRRPGPPGAIEGPMLTHNSNGEPLHLMMRHWVCEIGEVAIDGHSVTDGACVHCGVIVE